jgi:hypothetical protein
MKDIQLLIHCFQTQCQVYWKIMSTPKAKLHQVYANTGKRCVYETRAVVVEQAAPVVSPDGLLDFRGIKEERPTFECTLHLPDGSTFLSGSFSRKKDAEQEAARLALQQVLLSLPDSAKSLAWSLSASDILP